MQDNIHFTDSESYKGPGCLTEDMPIEDIGNQPNISESFSTTEIQSQSIPGYPGNSPMYGDKRKNY